jgi:RNA polymerase sigma-70 factor, ECF subfamily
MPTEENSLSDVALVKKALQEPQAYAAIVEKYQPKLFWYIRRISNIENEDIEDLLQEIFLKVYRNLNNYDSDMKFSSWIYRIAHNEVISNYRKLQARPQMAKIEWEIKDDILEQFVADVDIESDLVRADYSGVIQNVFAKMDVKYKEVLLYKYFEEKSYEEISDIIKKPVGTVGTLMSRAKKQFLKLYKLYEN